MVDNIDKAKTKKEEEDQRATVIVADVEEQKPEHASTNQAASCEVDCSHEVEVVCTTLADERVSRPRQGVKEACGEIIPDIRSRATFETSGCTAASSNNNNTAASSSRGSTVTRRPSDRLREKMTSGNGVRITSHEAQQYKLGKILDDAASGAYASGVSNDPQPSGKTAPPSLSSASAPGAYAIPGISAREEDGRNDNNQDSPVQVEEIPIDAFVADEPVAALAWDSVDQQIDEANDNHKEDGELKSKHSWQRAFFSVLGIVSLIVLVGVLIGVLISGPNNDGDIEIICRTSRIRLSSESGKGAMSVPNEAVQLNTGMEFGQDLDVDGDTLVVAAREAEDGTKVAFIFDRVKGKWLQNTKLEPISFVEPGYPIFAVAICGDYAFVGQSGDDQRGLRSGSVYVYVRSENNHWDFDSVLYLNGLGDEDMFGSSLACDGNNLIVGAMHRHDRKEIASSHGDFAEPNDRSHDGSAYILSRQEYGVWVQSAKLLPLQGNFQQQFGTSVAIKGDVAAVGSDKHDIGVLKAGSVHAYVKNDGEWALADVLLPDNLRFGDRFGTSLDIDSEGNIIAGAKFRWSNTGSAFIFRRRETNEWVQEAEVTASDGEVQRSFGNSVALLFSPGRDTSIAVVGAWKDSELHDRSGAAYVYQNEGGGVWNETIKLNPEELIHKSYFGNSVAIQEEKNGDTLEVFVGAGPLETVYSFELCINSN